MDACDRVFAALEPWRTSTRGLYYCPAHETVDKSKPSLSVDRGRKGVLLNCKGGPRCSAQDIVAALGLTMADLFYNRRGRRRRVTYPKSVRAEKTQPAEEIPRGDPMPTDYLERWPFRIGTDCEYRHPWVDENGRVLAWEMKVLDPGAVRAKRLTYRPSPLGPIGGITEDDYVQNGRDGGDFACWHKFTEEKRRKAAERRGCRPEEVPVRRFPAVRLPLWGLPEVRHGVRTGKTIVLVGGPKDAETARRVLDPDRYVATAWHGGESSFRKDLAETLRGANVIVSLDNDKAGRKGAKKTAKILRGVAHSARIAPPLGQRGYDFSDFVEELERAGRSLAEVRRELSRRLEATDGGTPSPMTDAWNAHRLAERHRRDLRYCAPWRSWLRWDGARWVPDQRNAAKNAAVETAISIHRIAARCKDKEAAEAWGDWAKRSQSAAKVRAMLDLASSHPALVVEPAELDADPWFLNLPNGSIDLQTGRFRPRDPNHRPLVMKVTGAIYDPKATCPTWNRYLHDVLVDEHGRTDPELVALMKRAAGLSLTGVVQDHVLLFLWGLGANGKTVWLETHCALLGDYAHVMPFSALVAKRHASGGPQPAIADLHGKRFVVASETSKGARFSEEQVKQLTGGDSITADRKYQKHFTFKPTHKLWIAANHRPAVHDSSEGFWRRLKVVPFRARFYKPHDPNKRGKPVDLQMEAKLRAELPGILNWALAGLEEWRRNGLGSCAAVDAASAAYREEENVLDGFLREWVTDSRGARVEKTKLYAAYKAFCEKAWETPVTHKIFSVTLLSLGYQHGRTGNSRFWKDLQLVDPSRGDRSVRCDGSSGSFSRTQGLAYKAGTPVTSVTSVTAAPGDSSLRVDPGGVEAVAREGERLPAGGGSAGADPEDPRAREGEGVRL